MKKIALCSVLTIILPGVASAESFEGVRVGAGYSHSEEDGENLGNGFKAELGYDFNQIVGASISYEESSTDTAITFNGTDYDLDVDGQALKLGVDLGYAFPLQEAFLKPYIKLGYQFYNLEVVSADFVDDEALYYGVGVRFQYKRFYSDLSFDTSEINSVIDTSADLTQTALTIGYKF